jgi:Transglutaminase-like superfamily
MSTSYFLAPHVHLCRAGKQVVLLDLERDKYLVLAHSHSIGKWVYGWPALPRVEQRAVGYDTWTAPVAAPLEPADQRTLGKMVALRMLVTDPAQGKVAEPVRIDEAKVALVEPQLLERPDATWGHFWRLCRAHWTAKWALKRRPIKEVVDGVLARKRRATAAALPLDVNRVRTLAAAFLLLRPILYTAHNACLLDSLTLIRFLAFYGVFPNWVFGVKTEPFHAHCWVQQGGYVFNDSPDFVGEFAPILVL